MLERFVLDSVSMTANTLQRISIISCVIQLNRVHLCLYSASHSCEMTKIFNYIQLKLIKFQHVMIVLLKSCALVNCYVVLGTV